jgi:undecaprenyl-phosphate galactose phosphotransferase/putative colanic acid biosynthesis UDP-glucose lipid carrier transferase
MPSVARIHESQTQILGSSIILTADLLAICCASYAADYTYHTLIAHIPPSFQNALTSGISVGLIYFLISCFDDHGVKSLSTIPARRIAWKFIVSLSIFLTSVFLLKVGAVFSRGQFLCFAVGGLLLLFANRQLFAVALRAGLVKVAIKPQRLAVIGSSSELRRAQSELLLEPSQFNVIEALDIDVTSMASALDRAISLSRSGSIDAVMLAIPWSENSKLESVVGGLREQALPIMLLPDAPTSRYIAHPAVTLSALPAYVIKRASLTPFEQLIKRTADIVLSLVALAIVWPIFLLAAVAIKFESNGPIFFRQRRSGFNSREFTIYKFRTMTACEDDDNVRQATRNDPRLTAVGAFLRRSSIDELPQLFNVLRGDMSIIGPRPHAIMHDREWARVVKFYARRHHIKPGITGLAQVNGFRGETNTEDKIEVRVRYDLQYIDNWSFWLDLQIMAKTLLVFAFQKNAY